MNEKENILRQTLLKFYPKATGIDVGVKPDPWIIFTVNGVRCEVHVSRSVPLDNFEEEAWMQFARLKKDVQLNEVDEDPVEEIVRGVDESV